MKCRYNSIDHTFFLGLVEAGIWSGKYVGRVEGRRGKSGPKIG